MEQDSFDMQNVIDPPDMMMAAGGDPVAQVTNFAFLHPPGSITEVRGLHYSVNAGGRNFQVYIVEGEDSMASQLSGGMGASVSGAGLTLTNTGDSFGALLDQQHVELAEIQDHIAKAAGSVAQVFNISQSFLTS